MIIGRLDKELITILFNRFHDKRLIDDVYGRMKTDSEKRQLLDYLNDNHNISRQDLVYKSIVIVKDRLGINI